MLVVHHLLPDASLMLSTFTPDMSWARRLVAQAGFSRLRPRIRARFGIDEAAVAHAYEKVAAAAQRVPRDEYLVGDRFTVADLALAALASPAVAPEQFPYAQPQRGNPRLDQLREALDQAGIGAFCRRMYALHRGTSAEIQM